MLQFHYKNILLIGIILLMPMIGWAQAPTFTSFGSSSTSINSSLVINGTNLTGTTSLMFGATPAKFTINSSTQITATVPRVANSGRVRITKPAGSALSTSIPVNRQSGANAFSSVTAAFNAIDIGNQSAPTFTDLDGDGLLDMIVGESSGNLNHYEQNTANSTSFTLISENFNGIDIGNQSAPTFTDLDGDGLLDMIVGGAVGNLNHYEQNTANSTSFTLIPGNFNGIDIGDWSTPTFTDLDGDGLLDMLVGEWEGNLNHYEQNAANSTSFTLVTANFNGIDVGYSSAPTFIDLDGDGLLDMLVGNQDVTLSHYEQNAANSTSFTYITDDFNGIDVGSYSAPTFTDLDGDGLLDMLVGEEDGNLNHFEQNSGLVISTLSAACQGSSFSITGTDLTGATMVTLNGTSVGALSGVTATNITFTVPANATSGNLVATSPIGTSNSVVLTVKTPLTFSSFGSASTAMNSSLIITGTNLTGIASVRFGETPARFTVNSSTQITATVPRVANTGTVSLSNGGCSALSSAIPVTRQSTSNVFTSVTATFNSIAVGYRSAPTFIDLDGDGLLDMLIGELDGNLNHYEQNAANSTSFTLVTANFNGIDVGTYSAPTFTDLDGDGLLDLLVGKGAGNLNHYEQNAANSTSFTLRTANFNGIGVGENSTPTFTDLDGDGLLDMIIGEVEGNLNHYEQNAANSTSFTLINGNFNTINVGIRSSPTFTDLDGDGLVDMILGDQNSGNLNHYEQNTANSTSFTLVTENFIGTSGVYNSIPTFTDLDGDGLLDMIVGRDNGTLSHYEQNQSPPTFTSFGSSSTTINSSLVINGTNLTGTSSVRFGETPSLFTVNSNTQITATVPRVANSGPLRITSDAGNALSTSIPVTRQSSSNLFSSITASFNTIDVGAYSTPTFTDLDGDGLLDMLIGNSNGNLNHYEQSAANSTSFTFRTATFNGINVGWYSIPTFTDLDGDGLLDMLIGEYEGNLNHYEQNAANSTSFTLINANFNAIEIGFNSNPIFTDLDGDGLLDMIVGEYEGNLNHYEQNAANSTSFTLINANFNGINVGVGGNSTPSFTDLDGDGLLDLFIGKTDGTISHYEQNAANSTSFTLINANFNAIDIGFNSNPIFTDLDGDGLLDMIVGEYEGNLNHYEQNQSPIISTLSASTACQNATVSITGTALTGATSVTINGTSVGALSGVTATNITFTVPTNATTGNVVVTTPSGTSNAVAFTVNSAPTFSSFGSATTAMNSSLVITGTNLTGTASVRFGETPALFTVNSSTQITATVPRVANTGTVSLSNGNCSALSTSIPVTRQSSSNVFSSVSEAFNGIYIQFYSSPTFTDLDGDDLLDMIIGREDGTLRHYEQNTANSTSFTLITENFSGIDVGSSSTPTFTDFDGDGLLDLLVGEQNGTLIHYEQNAANSTDFTLRTANFNTIDVGFESAPTFTDLDGDGLLDMIIGEYNGTLKHYEQIESNSTSFTLINAAFNTIDVGDRSSPTFTDIDGDGLLDMLIGEYYGTLIHYEQSAVNSTSFTLRTSTFNSINLGFYSKPTFTDLDGDGLLDMIVGELDGNLNHYEQKPPPTFTSFGSSSTAINSSLVITGSNFIGTTSVKFGEIPALYTINSSTQITATVPRVANTGRLRITSDAGNALSTSIPVTRQSLSNVFSSVNSAFNTIDIGTNSAPTFTDLDGDGLLDMLIGEFDGNLNHYEQNAANSISFTLVNATFNSINVGINSKPTFTDLDGDGLLDMLIGRPDGALSHYEQNIANSTSFTLITANFNSINVGFTSSPTFTDLDGDGLLDLIVGEFDGNLNHYEQNAANSTSFTLINAAFNTIDVGDRSSPTFTDVDGDGLLDMIIGEFDGNLNHYEQNAANSTSFTLRTASFNLIGVGQYSAPAFTDLDGDGLLDLIVGKNDGTLGHYEQNQSPIISTLSSNPACQSASVSITGSFLTGATSVTINGTSVGALSGVTATNITFTIPANATSGNVVVTTPNGTSNAASLNVNALPTTPTITGEASICAGSTSINTTYSLSTNEAYLWSDNSSASSLTVSAPGTYSLRIRNTVTGCTSAASNSIIVQENGPTILGSTGICTGGNTTLTTTRTLVTNEAYLWSNNSSASTLLVTAPGTYSLRIRNTVTGCTTVASNAITVTIIASPTFTSFSSSSTDMNSSLVITGNNFTDITSVKFGATPARFTVNTNTQITATVPRVANTGKVSLSNSTGCSVLSSSIPVTRQSSSNLFSSVSESFNTIYVGLISTPTFTDLDGDGLLDMIIGEQYGNLKHYEQNTANSTSFTLITDNFNGIDVGGRSTPTFTDLDGDGLLDMIIGEYDGNLNHYEQNAANSTGFTLRTANFNGIDVGLISTPTFTDLDGDGLLDMIIGEQDGNLNHYEQNTANSTEFTLRTANFNLINGGIYSSPTFTDLDGDGLLDMFVGEAYGTLNHYEQNATNSTNFNFVTTTFNGIDVGGESVPTFTDLDGDGLLDMLVGEGDGNLNHYEQNQSPIISTLSATCQGSSFSITGIGFTGATLVTINGTSVGTLSGVTATNITFNVPANATSGNVVVTTPNGTSNAVAITINPLPTFTSFGSSSTAMNSSLVITGTNLTGTASVRFGETPARFTVNSNTQITATVPRVANTGKVSLTNSCGSALSTSIPVSRQSSLNLFSSVTANFNAINIGIISAPAFTDLDGDGLLDMIVGEHAGNLNHYEQNTANSTSFTLVTASFNGISSVFYSRPTFTDLDGDGLLDMIVGRDNGTLRHYEQNTANSTSFTLRTANFNGIDVADQSAPAFTDLDGDGLLDMLVGEYDGNLNHYEQNAANSTSFTLITSNFNGIDVGFYSTPTFTDLDGDGLLDMISGEVNGALYHYEQNAANSTSFTLVTANFNGINVGADSRPTFTDIDGDGLLDLIVGEYDGNLNHYEQNQLPIISTLSANPACPNATVSITGTALTGATSVTINGTSVGALSGVTESNITFTVPANATSGNVVVTTPSGTSNAVVMTINALPTTPTIAGATLICPGGNTTLTTTATLGTNEAYLWSDNSSASTLTVFAAGTYSLRIRNTLSGCTSAASNGIVLSTNYINTTRTATVSANNICSNQPVTLRSNSLLQATISGSNNTPVAISSVGTPTITSNITVSSNYGLTTLDTIVIGFNILHTWDADLQITLISPTGKRALLVDRIGSSGDNFTSTFLSNYASNSIANFSAPFTGLFLPAPLTSSLSNLVGENVNGVWTLEINDVANSDGGTLSNWSIAIKSNKSYPLYTWKVGESTIATTANVDVAPLSTTRYILTQTNTNGCSVNDSVDVIVKPLPATPTIAGATSICSGNSTTLTTTATLGTNEAYLWSDNSSASTLTVNAAGTYSLRIRNTVSGCTSAASNNIVLSTNYINTTRTATVSANNICSNQPVTLRSNSLLQATISGSNNTPVAISSVGTPTITSNITVSSNYGLTTLDTIVIGFNILHTWDEDLQITLISPTGKRALLVDRIGSSSDNFTGTFLSNYASSSIANFSAPFTGLFLPAPLTSSLSNLVGENVNGIWTLEINDLANDDGGTLSNWSIAIKSNKSYPLYTWKVGESTIATTANVDVAPLSTTRYILTQTNANGCSVNDTVDVIVKPLPATPTIAGATSICPGGNTTLTTTATLGTNEAYLWSDNSSASTLSVSTAGTYTLRIRNTVTGCTSAVSNTVAVTVNSAPTFTNFGSASTAINSSLIITGTNLTGTTSVRFGETPALFTVNSSTQITATVPKVANSGKVSLTNSCGSSLSTSIPVSRQSSSNLFSSVTTAFNGIYVGSLSASTFTDLDGDGLLDMMIGKLNGQISHYEQNAANSTSFTLITNTFNIIDVGSSSTPTFTDFDGDGLLDMLVGEQNGTLIHYEQNAANGTSFTLITNNFNGIDVGFYSAPTFTDLDGDGLLDMIIGENEGNLNHYEQNAANSSSFTLITSNFNGIDVGFYSSPTFTDLDGDGLLDMIIGEYNGTLIHYEQNAANSTSFTLITNTFNGIDVGFSSSPNFTDLDGDGLLDMIIGESDGNLNHYEQNQSPKISTLSVNPACVGSTVSITGTDFTGATLVTINGTSVGTLSGVTATNITFTVPATATTGNIVVTTPSGTSNAIAMTINALPNTPTITGANYFCSGGSTVLTSTVTTGTYLWNTGATSQSITVSAIGDYNVRVITNGCTSAVSSNNTVTTLPTGTWLGTTTDWNTATNWCGGVPTATTDITLPITGLLPTITGTTATCRNLTIPVGVTLNIENGANFNLKGNLSGLGSIAGVSGSTLTLSGSAAQTIQRVNVGTLALNNSAGALLGGNVVVRDGVALTNGILNTQTHNLILLNTATSPTETANSYVIGNIRSTARMIGTGTGSMFGITIAAGTDNLDTVMIERGENAATYNGNEGIGHIWKIRAGNQPVSGRQITLAWNPRADNGKDITRLQVYRRPDTGGEWIRMGGIVNGSSRSISLTTNSFSDWTVSDQDAPLPVTLTSFTGKATQLGNQLNWTTSSEVNNQGFNIERSVNGKTFTKIGFVKGNGTINTKQTYQFTDLNSSEAYYRLQQLDFDGKTEYSATITVGERSNLTQLDVFPNPASDQVTIQTNGEGTLEIVNMVGKVVITQPAKTTNEINISKLAKGVYTVKFNGVSQKLVVR